MARRDGEAMTLHSTRILTNDERRQVHRKPCSSKCNRQVWNVQQKQCAGIAEKDILLAHIPGQDSHHLFWPVTENPTHFCITYVEILICVWLIGLYVKCKQWKWCITWMTAQKRMEWTVMKAYWPTQAPLHFFRASSIKNNTTCHS